MQLRKVFACGKQEEVNEVEEETPTVTVGDFVASGVRWRHEVSRRLALDCGAAPAGMAGLLWSEAKTRWLRSFVAKGAPQDDRFVSG